MVNISTAVVIADDPAVQDVLLDVFTAAGFDAIGATSGTAGIALVREQQPLITAVTVTLPGIDGFETVRRVRGISGSYLVLIATHDDEADAVLGLSIGADDYVTMPLRPREFRARVEAMLRRPRARASRDAPAAASVAVATPPGVIRHSDLTVDPETFQASRATTTIPLTRTEFDLLRTLMESGRRTRSKDDLALVTRGDHPVSTYVSDLDRRAIEAHIANLRRKLGDSASRPTYIETVRGVGYRMTIGAHDRR